MRRSILIIAILVLVTQRSSAKELPRGLITLSGVRSKVEVTSGSETYRVRNGTQLVEGVSIHVGMGARVVMLLANGAALLVIGEAKVYVENFEILPFESPQKSLYDMKREPSFSRTVLAIPYGEFFCEVKVLDARSRFVIKTSFSSVSPLPNPYLLKTSFYVLSRKGEQPSIASWHGRIGIESPNGEIRPVNGDSHIFLGNGKTPRIARGLEWSYVKMLERHMNEVHRRQKKFRFR